MKYLRKHPTTGGKATLEITIDSSGTVKNVKILSNKMTKPDFVQKLVDHIKFINFGKREGADVVVAYPFKFIPH